MHINSKLFFIMFKHSNYNANALSKVSKLTILKSLNTIKYNNLKKLICNKRKGSYNSQIANEPKNKCLK